MLAPNASSDCVTLSEVKISWDFCQVWRQLLELA